MNTLFHDERCAVRRRGLAHQRGGSGPRRRGVHGFRGGFSIIDLLVSIAVIGVLIAVLLPSIAMVQEVANRTRCASNLRNIGMATQMWAYDRDDRLPSSVFAEQTSAVGRAPQEMVHLRLGPEVLERRGVSRAAGRSQWDGLGRLYGAEYVNEPRVFYCPSHSGEHTFDRYASQWMGEDGTIVGNYQYRLPTTTPLLTRMTSTTTIAADAIRTQAEYNHGDGNNMLKADMSVSWFADTSGTLYNLLGQSHAAGTAGADAVDQGWALMDSFNGGLIDPSVQRERERESGTPQGSLGGTSASGSKFPR